MGGLIVTKVTPLVSQVLSRSRSGLLLAWARLAMAALFGLWVWLDPAQPARSTPDALPLYLAYLVIAAGLLAIGARSWWFDHRLARAAFALDALAFVAGLYATEAVTLDLFSVFITAFAFLILSATIRWGRRTTNGVAIALLVSFAVVGLLLNAKGLELDWARFLRRLAYLALLAALLAWFARSRQVGPAPRFVPAVDDGLDPLAEVRSYAMRAYGAGFGQVAWLDNGEKRPRISSSDGLAPRIESLPSNDAPFLFDHAYHRRLILQPNDQLVARIEAAPDRLLKDFPVPTGLAIPIEGRTGHGLLVLGALSGLCSDDLQAARSVANEVARAMDEEAAQALARDLAMTRLRSQLAADLHDSVAQTLAGVQFRLAALRNRITGQGEADELAGISEGVAAEQRHVRAMIDRLRNHAVAPGPRDLRQELLALIAPLARHWQVTIDLAETGNHIPLSIATIYEVQQIVREAVANAVRHGRASRIALALTPQDEGGFTLDIRDNGKGSEALFQPRTIADRVAALGGTLLVSSGPGETALSVQLKGAPE